MPTKNGQCENVTLHKIGEQWRQEMTELTLKYQTKLKHEQNKNKKLREHLKYLQVDSI